MSPEMTDTTDRTQTTDATNATDATDTTAPTGTMAMHYETITGTEANAEVHIKTIALVLAIDLIYLTQLVLVVGSAAYAREITAVVGGASQTVWFTSVLTICIVSFSPPVAQAADYWGRKWFLVLLTGCGIIGSIVVSRATTFAMAIAGLTVAGLSFSAQPLLHAVVSEVLPRKWRPAAQASINISASVGGVISLLGGGAMMRHGNGTGFRPYFYMTAAFYAVSTLVCALLYNPPPRELQTALRTREKLRRLDWIGYVLVITGLTMFCLGLSWSQNPYPWTNAHVLAPFLVGSVLAIMFFVYEAVVRKDGMVHHGLFGHRNFGLCLACIFVEGLIFFANNNYYPFETSVLVTQDPLKVGLHYSILFYSLALSAIIAGLYCSKRKSLHRPIVFSFVCFLVFNIVMATIRIDTPRSIMWGMPVISGFGLGICVVALLALAQLSTPRELIALASGLMITMRGLGGTVGLAIYNAIFNHSFGTELGPRIAGAVLPLGLPEKSLGPFILALLSGQQAALAQVPGVTPDIIGAAVGALTEAYLVGFRYVWVAAACFSAVAIVMSVFLQDPKSEFNAHIDAPVEGIEVEHRRETAEAKA